MSIDYFKQLNNKTNTKFWINNPTGNELASALDEGAVSCTTNPAYCSKLIKTETEYIHCVIDQVIRETRDNDEAALEVYRRVSKRLLDGMYPLYEKSKGQYGFVTIQDDPRRDENADSIVKASLEAQKLGKNYMAKIPVVHGGIEAIQACMEENIPVCATEIFSISQAMHICRVIEKVQKHIKTPPPVYVTHISGIFDEYLHKTAKRENIHISPEIIDQAGIIIAKKEYRMFKDYGYQVTLLGGGARGIHHFTKFVGSDAHITVNWSTAKEIIDTQPFEIQMDSKSDPNVISELSEKFSDFQKAYNDEGLSLNEFAQFGPVQLFRNAFLKGWYELLAEIVSRRHLYAI